MSAGASKAAAGNVSSLADSLGLRPGDVEAMVRLACQDESRGRFDDAIEVLRVAAVLDPRVLAVWDGLGRCYSKVGDGSRAEAAARVAQAIRRATAKG